MRINTLSCSHIHLGPVPDRRGRCRSLRTQPLQVARHLRDVARFVDTRLPAGVVLEVVVGQGLVATWSFRRGGGGGAGLAWPGVRDGLTTRWWCLAGGLLDHWLLGPDGEVVGLALAQGILGGTTKGELVVGLWDHWRGRCHGEVIGGLALAQRELGDTTRGELAVDLWDHGRGRRHGEVVGGLARDQGWHWLKTTRCRLVIDLLAHGRGRRHGEVVEGLALAQVEVGVTTKQGLVVVDMLLLRYRCYLQQSWIDGTRVCHALVQTTRRPVACIEIRNQ